MPELPEVELISRSLNTLLRGRQIVSAKLLRQRLAPHTAPPVFARRLRDRQVNVVTRRGKHILFDLNGGLTLIVHLRMSGRFSILPDERENPKFTHAVFNLADGGRLVFDDQRHFGFMRLVDTQALAETNELKKLAPEPFSDEFSIDHFRTVLRGSGRRIKEVLLDQTKVTGVGNIYASEALYVAAVYPGIRANKLTGPKAARLHESIRVVLREAIDFGAKLPVDPENLEGNYFSSGAEPTWTVYDRENQPCRACATPIARLKQAGRSTYYCRKCQRR
ncbi:MAG TPA: bifunctional DNA-formamidopyrimidine glycosylase/DNA-(apurinic or apyrimidinic site) lyase [Pyrinomonadaceae bacterium]|nr:bifunctional DNA-formamidopyrimidine glycosylase/DNA-(apurinic or apyrimidinic site) lyase [Pyrinomonadaceae bacterium]